MEAPDSLAGFIEAVKNLAWYAVFGYGAWLVIALWNRWKPELFDSIPARLQWLPAYVISGLTAFAVAFSAGLDWPNALGAGVLAALTGGQIAVGTHRTLKEVSQGAHRRRMSTPPEGTRARGSVLLVLMFALMVPVGLTSCIAGLPPVVATVFNSVAVGLQAIQTIRDWLARVQGAPGVSPHAYDSLTASLAKAEGFLLEARELGLKGAETAEQAEKTKDQGMAALQQAWDSLKQLGLVRDGRLVDPPDGVRSDVPTTTRVHLPAEVR